ncbi:MAG: hypothetical protein ACLGI9_14340 [Thermoanaerobaculia bacterium]
MIQKEIQRSRQVLCVPMRILDISNRDVEKAFDLSHSYLDGYLPATSRTQFGMAPRDNTQ